jgi:hypothetical protein
MRMDEWVDWAEKYISHLENALEQYRRLLHEQNEYSLKLQNELERLHDCP